MTDWRESEQRGVRGYRCDSLWLPRCSEVLDVLFPDAMRYIDTGKLERGTRLHQAVQNGLRMGKWDEVQKTLPDADVPAFTAIRRWVHQWVAKTVLVEEVMTSVKYGYASRIDCAVLVKPDMTLVVPDWKFAENHDLRYDIQAEAHRHLDFETPPHVWIIAANGSGEVRVRKHKDNAIQWHYFLSALNVLKCRMQNGRAA